MNGEGKASGSYVEARAVSELDETLDAEGSRGAGERIGRFRSRVLCPQVHFVLKVHTFGKPPWFLFPIPIANLCSPFLGDWPNCRSLLLATVAEERLAAVVVTIARAARSPRASAAASHNADTVTRRWVLSSDAKSVDQPARRYLPHGIRHRPRPRSHSLSKHMLWVHL